MRLFGPPRNADLRAWKIYTFSLCWTAVLIVFLSKRHRRSNPPTYSTHPDMYGSTRKTAEMTEGSQEADRDWDSSIQVLRCQIKLKSSQYFPIFRFYLPNMTTVMKVVVFFSFFFFIFWAFPSDIMSLSCKLKKCCLMLTINTLPSCVPTTHTGKASLWNRQSSTAHCHRRDSGQ